MPTSNLEELYKDRPAFAHSFVAQGSYFLGRGGMPIFSAGSLVGAIGVSGATAHGEEVLAINVVEGAPGFTPLPDRPLAEVVTPAGAASGSCRAACG